jgi:hypothetical protein
MDYRPAFLITIDTEGDNLWALPSIATTLNARFIPRFQLLCERYSLRPTYLTNYEMASDSAYQEFARDVLRRATAEIGMHLHAWDSPPLIPLTRDDFSTHPYLIEFPEAVMREKIHVITNKLEQTFGVKMLSHRAGRWSFDSRYARMLKIEGYEIDCSVTPRVSWERSLGHPSGRGGTDYRHYPDAAYWLGEDDISIPHVRSSLLEVPVSIFSRQKRLPRACLASIDAAHPIIRNSLRPLQIALRRLYPPAVWLRPSGTNLSSMMWLVERVFQENRDYAQFMLHSSELMPGGSPTFKTEHDIEDLYAQLEVLFGWVSTRFVGLTLTEYKRRFEEAAL